MSWKREFVIRELAVCEVRRSYPRRPRFDGKAIVRQRTDRDQKFIEISNEFMNIFDMLKIFIRIDYGFIIQICRMRKNIPTDRVCV